MKDLILLGCGGHAKSCVDVIEAEGKYRILGLIDAPEKDGSSVLGYPVIGHDEMLPEFCGKDVEFLITVGHVRSHEARSRLFARIGELGLKPATIVSPLARVSRYAEIGAGTIVMHYAFVNASARVGANCIINTKALVEHDAEVGDTCHISTAAVVNGAAKIGGGTFVGSNATVANGAVVPPETFVKAGSVVK